MKKEQSTQLLLLHSLRCHLGSEEAGGQGMGGSQGAVDHGTGAASGASLPSPWPHHLLATSLSFRLCLWKVRDYAMIPD